MSIAALKSRRIMLVAQLRKIFFFAMQIIVKLCSIDANLATVEILQTPINLKHVRKVIVLTRDDSEALLRFQYALENKFQHVKFVIETLANTNVELMKLHDIVMSIRGIFVADPLGKLFHHLLKHSYIAPIVLLDDDLIGSNYERLCESVDSFADNLLELRDPNTLSASVLQRLEIDENQEIDEEEAKQDVPSVAKQMPPSRFDLDEIVASAATTHHLRRPRETKQIVIR